MNSNVTEFFMDEASPSMTGLSIKGDFFREEDLPYWLRGLKNYIQLEARQSGIAKWLLDRVLAQDDAVSEKDSRDSHYC